MKKGVKVKKTELSVIIVLFIFLVAPGISNAAKCEILLKVVEKVQGIEKSQKTIEKNTKISLQMIEKVCEAEVRQKEPSIVTKQIRDEVKINICVKEKLAAIQIINDREKLRKEESIHKLIEYLKENSGEIKKIAEEKKCEDSVEEPRK